MGTANDSEVLSFVQTLVIGDRAWIDDGSGWRETTSDDEAISSALFHCGSAWNTESSGAPDFGQSDTYEGVPVRVGDLVEEGFVAEMVIDEAHVELLAFRVVITEAGMLVRSEIEGSGSAAELAATAGWEYEGSAEDVGEYHQRITITHLNDPTLHVDEPEV